MQRSWFAGVLFLSMSSVVAAGPAPSDVMRKIPLIPANPTAEQCEAAASIASDAQSQAQQDMMRAQQLAMQAMTPTSGAITDRQGALIAKIVDPSYMSCDMNLSMSMLGMDPGNTFREGISGIRNAVEQEIETKCPVTDFADYRDPACVEPIRKRGFEKERTALAQYIVGANAVLKKEIDGFAQCSEAREKLFIDVQAAKLPANYSAIAQSGRASGWQQVGALVQRYENLCSDAVTAAEDLKMREDSYAEH